MLKEASVVNFLAHEFKTPISNIKSSAEILELASKNEKLKDKISVDEYLTSIKDQCDKLTLLIKNIYSYVMDKSNFGDNTICCQEILTYLEEFKKILIPIFAKQNCKFEIIMNTDEVFFSTNYLIFERIISNLVSNAMKYNDKSNKKITLTITGNKKEFRFDFADNGNGISNTDIEKIKEPFFRSEKAKTSGKDGCGLGLYIISEFLEYLNGRMEIKSKLNVGSTFSIIIPQKNTTTTFSPNGNSPLLKMPSPNIILTEMATVK